MARILLLTLNGRVRNDAISDNLLLLDYLREIVGLTGTKTDAMAANAVPAPCSSTINRGYHV